jgi:hypothetical protein
MSVACECCVLSEVSASADLLSRGVLSSVVCLSVIVKPDNQEAVAHWGLLCHGGKYVEICFLVFVVWLFTLWSSGF